MRDSDEDTWHNYERDLRAGRKSPLTIDGYRHAVELLSAALPDSADLLSATAADIAAWLAEGAGTWESSTHATYAKRVRTFYAWAYKNDWVERDPTAKLPKVIEVVKEVAIPDPADVRTLIRACAGRDFYARRDLALITLLCEPGTPRASELAGMLVERLDMRHDEYTILGKGSLERTVPFGALSGKALALYLRARKEHKHKALPYVWLGKYGRITRSGVADIIDRRCRQAGIPAINPHGFRHMTADLWFSDDGSTRDAKKLFGWRSDAMPNRYGAAAAGRRAREHARERSLGDRLLLGD